MTEMTDKIYPSLPNIRKAPTAPPVDGGHSYRLNIIRDVQNFLEEEIKKRESFSKKYFRIAKVVNILDNTLITITIGAEGAGAILLATGAGAPFGIEELPTKLFRKIFPSLELKASDIMNLGPLAVNALLQAFTKKNIDLTFGLYAIDGKFKIGSEFVDIEDNDIKINDKIFEGTPGFWELITSKDPNPDSYTEEDLNKYRQLVILTNTAFQNNNPANKPKSSKSPKWKKIIKPIWIGIKEFEEDEEETEGSGLSKGGQSPKILPSDPNALIDRFDLLFSSQNAGHTGVRNEIVSILDELKRQGVIKTNEYKKLNSLIKK